MEEKVYPKVVTVYDKDYALFKMLHAYLVEKYGRRIKMKTIFEKMVQDAWINKEDIDL